jgi:hypothetical protein
MFDESVNGKVLYQVMELSMTLYAMPMVTALPFFPPFFIANFCLFCQKVNSRCLQLYLFVCLFLSPSSFYYAGNPYLFFGFGANTFPPSTSASRPPCPSPPTPPPLEAAVCLAIPVNVATNYILPVPHSPL